MNHDNTHTDPRVLRTRRMLKDALIDMLEETNADKITVNGLTKRAQINRVTFYLHYQDIPDMLDKMANEMIQDVLRVVRDPELDNYRNIDVDWPALLRLLEHIAEHFRFFKVILTKNRTTVFTERLLSLIKNMIIENLHHKEMKQSMERVGLKQDIASWYGSAALIGAIMEWLRGDMPYTPLFLAKQITLIRQYHGSFMI